LGILSLEVSRSALSPCCPGKKAGVEAKKGREKPSWFIPLGVRKEMRRQRDNRAETAEVRIRKRGTTAFFAKVPAFLPGQGILWPSGIRSIHRTPEYIFFSERIPIFFPTNLELIQIQNRLRPQ
jgi:hypothetical protein